MKRLFCLLCFVCFSVSFTGCVQFLQLAAVYSDESSSEEDKFNAWIGATEGAGQAGVQAANVARGIE